MNGCAFSGISLDCEYVSVRIPSGRCCRFDDQLRRVVMVALMRRQIVVRLLALTSE